MLRICVEALKMAENHDNNVFTFLPFLPPHIGVSSSLVSRKRKSVKRSIDWYQKNLNFKPCSSVFDRFCVLWKNIVESPSKFYVKSTEIYEHL